MKWRADEAPPSLRETLAALCVPDGAPRDPRYVRVQIHLVGEGATDAFHRIVDAKRARGSVMELDTVTSAKWGNAEAAVEFTLLAREEERPGLDTEVVVVADGGDLP